METELNENNNKNLIRTKLEINGFFWAFLVTLYTAYFKVLTEIKTDHGSLILCIISAIIAIYGFAYMMVTVSSRGHIIVPEGKYSITNVYMILSDIIAAVSYALFVYEFKCTGCSLEVYILSMVIYIILIVLLFWFGIRNADKNAKRQKILTIFISVALMILISTLFWFYI